MRFFLIGIFFCIVLNCQGQSNKTLVDDTATVMKLIDSANIYDFYKADTGVIFSKIALDMARRLHFKKGEAEALNVYGESYHILGNFPEALKIQFQALALNREMKDRRSEIETLGYIGIVYIQLGEYREALHYLLHAQASVGEIDYAINKSFALANIGDAYDRLKIPDSAIYYMREAYHFFPQLTRPHLRSFILRHMGATYMNIGENDSAFKFFHAAILNTKMPRDNINMSMAQKQVADLYNLLNRDDSSIVYAHEAFLNAQKSAAKPQMLDASLLLETLYKKAKKPDSVIFYADVAAAIKDSLYGPEKFRQLQVLMLQEQENQQTILQQQEQLRDRVKYTSLLSALGVFLLLAFIQLRNIRSKQKANNLLKEQKSRIEETLSELKSTQAQLIQREKMASLGELTAGIAHEIQNPLNFVNNFSDVNTELIEELNQEAAKGNLEEMKAIAKNIKDNEEKINHHGKRADAIVKGMLQHSRSNSGNTEFVDINALADEYMRLSYHGLRAKDPSFNAIMKTEFDDKAGHIDIVPQEIGRVLLNIFNNAFYAVHKKEEISGADYQPTVSMKTKRSVDSLEIIIKDNGTGIPEPLTTKIFQPFFTTKPAGQGTGLGLSLSYDIIKAHGGEIRFKSKDGEGTEFIVALPIKS